jgi:hypothetical protein
LSLKSLNNIKGLTGDGLEFVIDKVNDRVGIRVKPNNGTSTDEYTYTGNLTGISILYSWEGTRLGIKNSVEENYTYTDLKGDAGFVYTPVVTELSDDVILSWTNNGNLTNPANINIRGPKGDKGDTGTTLFTIVTANTFAELPSTGETGIIYCVPNGTSGSNSFDNYLWYNGAYDRFGSLEVDLSDYYNKSEVDTNLGLKANTSDVYTKTEVDTSLSTKANSSDVYSKTEIDNLIGTANDIITG